MSGIYVATCIVASLVPNHSLIPSTYTIEPSMLGMRERSICSQPHVLITINLVVPLLHQVLCLLTTHRHRVLPLLESADPQVLYETTRYIACQKNCLLRSISISKCCEIRCRVYCCQDIHVMYLTLYTL